MVDVLKSADFIEKIAGSELMHVQCMLCVVIVVLGMAPLRMRSTTEKIKVAHLYSATLAVGGLV